MAVLVKSKHSLRMYSSHSLLNSKKRITTSKIVEFSFLITNKNELSTHLMQVIEWVSHLFLDSCA